MLNKGQGADLITQHFAEMAHVAGPDLQHEIEIARDHHAGFNFINSLDSAGKGAQVLMTGAAHDDMYQGEMVEAEEFGLDHGTIALDGSLAFQPPDPLRAGRFCQVHLFGQINNGNPPLSLQNVENASIYMV